MCKFAFKHCGPCILACKFRVRMAPLAVLLKLCADKLSSGRLTGSCEALADNSAGSGSKSK